jgi:poly(ADP-ribose) glycohydrolase ARH3
MTLTLKLRDRTRGALLGAVVGDAFGNPLEGASASDLQSQLQRRAQSSGPWRYTDDGAMFIALAESISGTGSVVPVHFLRQLNARYDPVRGFGRGMKLALRSFEQGSPWEKVAYVAWPEGSRGNGGAVRVGPVALRRWTDSPSMLSAAAVATRVTHAHDEAITAALVQVGLLAVILQEPNSLDRPLELLAQVFSTLPASQSSPAFLEKLQAVVRGQLGPVDIARSLGTSTLALESVPAAIGSFLRCHETFELALLHAAAMGGDVDSICAIVGCLSGALHGFQGIPSRWITAIQNDTPTPEELCTLADRLCQLEPATHSHDAVYLA